METIDNILDIVVIRDYIEAYDEHYMPYMYLQKCTLNAIMSTMI